MVLIRLKATTTDTRLTAAATTKAATSTLLSPIPRGLVKAFGMYVFKVGVQVYFKGQHHPEMPGGPQGQG